MKRLTLLIAFVAMLAMTSFALAQDATPEAAAQATTEAIASAAAPYSGVGTLVLLIGLGALFIVAAIWLIRERSTADNQPES